MLILLFILGRHFQMVRSEKNELILAELIPAAANSQTVSFSYVLCFYLPYHLYQIKQF